METELKEWLIRYPAPLTVYAWDNAEHLYKFDELNKPSFLMGFVNEAGEMSLYWKTGTDKTIPDARFDQEYLDNLFSSLKYTTVAEYDVDRKKRRRQIKLGYVIIVALPFISFFAYECFLYFNDLFALVAFIYFIIKTWIEAFRLLKILPKSKREREREKEDVLKNHYYYYCQLNPQGFEKLKLEALEKMAKDEVAKQAKEVKLKTAKKGSIS
jgi:hypothetical protein